MSKTDQPFCILPDRLLSKFIKCFWISQAEKSDKTTKSRLLPEGHIEIVFSLGGPDKIYRADNSTYLGEFKKSQLVGQRTQPLLLKSTGEKNKIGIRFKPGGLYPFLQIPLHEISNTLISLESVLGNVYKEWEEKLYAAKSDIDKIDILQQKLKELMSSNFRDDKVLGYTSNYILLNNGSVSINKIAEKIGMSTRQLNRRFSTKVGLSPKSFSRIIRFQAILRALKRHKTADFAPVAYHFGFCDQSHFNKEFKTLSGTTPKKFFSPDNQIVEIQIQKNMSDFYNTHP